MALIKRTLVLFCTLSIASSVAVCQYKNVRGIEYIKSGDRVLGFVDFAKQVSVPDPDFDSARYYYRKGAEIFQADTDYEQFTEAATKYAWTHSYELNYEQSYLAYDSIYQKHGEIILKADTARINFFNSWAWSGFNSSYQYEAYLYYGRTIKFLKELGLDNHWMVINAHLWRGRSARQFGMYQVAKGEYLKVLEMSVDFPAYRNGALNSLGILARREGDFLRAEAYYREILSTLKSPQIANNLAYLYVKMGKYHEALGMTDSLIQVLREQYDDKQGGIHSAIFNTEGEAFLGLQDFESALTSFEKSRSFSMTRNQSISEAAALIDIAGCKINLGRIEEVRTDLASARKIIFGQENPNPLLISEFFTTQSRVADNPLESVTSIDSALQYLGYLKYDSIDHIVNRVEVTNLLLEKTKFLKIAIETPSIDPDLTRDEIDHSFLAAVELMKRSYRSISTNESKADLMASSQKLVDEYLSYSTSQPSISYNDVFNLFEFNKSNQLIQALNDREMSGTDSTYARLAEVDWQINQLNVDGSEDSLLIALTLERERLSNAVDRFRIGNSAANYATTLRDVEKAIGRSGGYFEYFVGPENTYVFNIIRGRPAVYNLGNTDSLNELAKAFQEAILSHNFDQYAQLGSKLVDKLMPDYLRTQPLKMVVIPDGFISGLSFDALPIRSGTNYLDTKYVVQQSSISVHYSSGMYLNSYRQYEGEQLLAGFAPLAAAGDTDTYRSGNRLSFSGLPYSAEEVTMAVDVLSGVPMVNEQATEKAFKETAPDYSLVHIATHNITDPYNPGSSTLVFAYDSLSQEDGLLQISEIQAMRLNADLVNLSACNSGVGEYVVGEGMMSLARGFIFAGARNVIMSKWLVDDRSTSDLMQKFYTQYKESSDAGIALRQAKLQYLDRADEVTADPYYWGAWVHVGPENEKEGAFRNVMILVIIILGGLIFYRVLIKGV